MDKAQRTEIDKGFNYPNMFWLFMIANVLGVILEGVWTVYKFGRWETHVVTIWGPFCLLYGVGAVVFYIGCVKLQGKHLLIQFLSFAIIADVVEYICALMIEDGLNLRAWTYKRHIMNLQGRICLQMTIIWGVIGVIYLHILIPRIEKLFKKIQGRFWRNACIVMTIFMIVNMFATSLCLIRWSRRHKGKEPANRIERFIDQKYDDARMHHIFCEWWFIDEQEEFWKQYKRK